MDAKLAGLFVQIAAGARKRTPTSGIVYIFVSFLLVLGRCERCRCNRQNPSKKKREKAFFKVGIFLIFGFVRLEVQKWETQHSPQMSWCEMHQVQ
jgi:uncharacterized protein (DUF983 family)